MLRYIYLCRWEGFGKQCYHVTQKHQRKKGISGVSSDVSSVSDICGYETGIKPWYHHSRQWAPEQILYSSLCDSVFQLMNLSGRYCFPPPTWIQKLKAGYLSVYCPNITNLWTLSPALVRKVACLGSRSSMLCWGRSKGNEQRRLQKKRQGKRYANMMTSSLRGEERAENSEARAKSHTAHIR